MVKIHDYWHKEPTKTWHKRFDIGTWIHGDSLPASVHARVVAIGHYNDIEEYDESRVMYEAIRMGCNPNYCVAVRFKNGETAIYPADEVFPVKEVK